MTQKQVTKAWVSWLQIIFCGGGLVGLMCFALYHKIFVVNGGIVETFYIIAQSLSYFVKVLIGGCFGIAALFAMGYLKHIMEEQWRGHTERKSGHVVGGRLEVGFFLEILFTLFSIFLVVLGIVCISIIFKIF